ncbi:MAG: glycosyltransferase family 9 protein [Bdellovibrionales bacterium]|nr:glycosyltransferase family 9 protein [Bdellovibrionales bacterium]
MGDVILSTSALEVLRAQSPDAQIHWVIRQEFSDLLKSDSRIQKLWIHNRKTGFSGWMKLVSDLKREDFTHVIDLHRSLRSQILLLSFFLAGKFARTTLLSKERYRNWGYYLFKKLWPKAFRPRPYRVRAAEAALKAIGGDLALAQNFNPAMPNFAQKIQNPETLNAFEEFLKTSNGRKPICIMGGAQWLGKRLSREAWKKFFDRNSEPVVILGTDSDEDSVWLASQMSGRSHFSAVGKLSLPEVAWVISQSARVYSNDTGIVHLAEAIGVPVTAFFGPTRSDLGFGPWMKQSNAIEAQIWCSPCSKDGSACFRIGSNRFACQKSFQGAPFA